MCANFNDEYPSVPADTNSYICPPEVLPCSDDMGHDDFDREVTVNGAYNFFGTTITSVRELYVLCDML